MHQNDIRKPLFMTQSVLVFLWIKKGLHLSMMNLGGIEKSTFRTKSSTHSGSYQNQYNHYSDPPRFTQQLIKKHQEKMDPKRIIMKYMRSFMRLTNNPEETQVKDLTTYGEKGLMYCILRVYKHTREHNQLIMTTSITNEYTSLYKSLTLYFRKGDVCCVWEMSGDKDGLLYWPKFFSRP